MKTRMKKHKEKTRTRAIPMPAVEGALLTPAQAAALLGVTAETLCVWRCVRRYPELAFVKIGSKVMYKRADIEAFIEARRVAA